MNNVGIYEGLLISSCYRCVFDNIGRTSCDFTAFMADFTLMHDRMACFALGDRTEYILSFF